MILVGACLSLNYFMLVFFQIYDNIPTHFYFSHMLFHGQKLIKTKFVSFFRTPAACQEAGGS